MTTNSRYVERHQAFTEAIIRSLQVLSLALRPSAPQLYPLGVS